MAISEHLELFADRPVVLFDPEKPKAGGDCVYRLGLEYDSEQTFPELLDLFLTHHDGPSLTSLIVGYWGTESSDPGNVVIEALIAQRERMPNLLSLFLGDITYQENEISWIQWGDVSALLPAFPKLEEFRIRGASNLTFGTIRHKTLKSFAIESGGLPMHLLEEVWAADLPSLTHLELWLGTPSYEGIGNVIPLQPLLKGDLFPNLTYLGLRNSDIADEVAAGIAASPLMERLRVLDLSLGNLGDDGARALLANPATKSLDSLLLSHSYLSAEVIEEFNDLGINVDLSEAQDAEAEMDDRYITASE